MPISGVVITCRSGMSLQLTPLLTSEQGVEVHGCPDDSTIIAVIESGSVQGQVDTVKRISDLDGVQAVRLAYHNFEDLDDTDAARKES